MAFPQDTQAPVDRRCPISEQTPEEEILNVLTHGAGCVLACWAGHHVCGTYLVAADSLFKKAMLVVYLAAWIILYGTSTIYHASRFLPRKKKWRVYDHCAIFVVIAASYGPYVSYVLQTPRGHTLWVLSWVIAALGCLFKFKSRYRYHAQSTWFYILQGWMVTLCLPTLISGMSLAGLLWMLFGGLSMSFGVYFYLRDEVKYNHCVWHVSVILASLGFYLSILEILQA